MNYLKTITEITYDVQNFLASILSYFTATKPSILLSNLHYDSGVTADGNLLVLYRTEKADVFDIDQLSGELTISSFDVEPIQNDESQKYYIDQSTGELIYDET